LGRAVDPRDEWHVSILPDFVLSARSAGAEQVLDRELAEAMLTAQWSWAAWSAPGAWAMLSP
jgi:hypothetical protein